jgi:hypothetical protein
VAWGHGAATGERRCGRGSGEAQPDRGSAGHDRGATGEGVDGPVRLYGWRRRRLRRCARARERER